MWALLSRCLVDCDRKSLAATLIAGGDYFSAPELIATFDVRRTLMLAKITLRSFSEASAAGSVGTVSPSGPF